MILGLAGDEGLPVAVQPLCSVGEPGLRGPELLRAEDVREKAQRASHFGKRHQIDDPGRRSRLRACRAAGEVKGRGEAGGRCEEPGPEVRDRALRVGVLARDQEAGDQGGEDGGEGLQRHSVSAQQFGLRRCTGGRQVGFDLGVECGRGGRLHRGGKGSRGLPEDRLPVELRDVGVCT